jgi:membrane-bound lytic murein transglycosylase F
LIKKLLIFLLIAGAIFTSCSRHSSSKSDVVFDLDSIISRGKLVVVTDFNSTSYFIYRGEPMGFNYELLKSFSDHIGIDLEIYTENHLDRAFEKLNSGGADLLAIGLTINSTRKNDIQFSEPIAVTRQVLVQRKPTNWRSMTQDLVDKKLIRDQLDLRDKTVYVQKGSSHVERLFALASEIGEEINIVEVPYEAEQLIENVAKGEIDYAVCDENVGIVNATYYSDIDINTPLSFQQNIAWAVRKEHSSQLLEELNNWIRAYKTTRSYALLYAKYFKNSRSSRIVSSDYYAISTGKVSQWDDLIKTASHSIQWDWRLLASLICQESGFKPDVESWAGAYGLMQIMPGTGQLLGIDITSSPENNIKAGIKYLSDLQSIFENKIPDEEERIRFVLASYNAGPGHVLDAMKLAEKNGKDPGKWDDNVAVWLLKKSDPQYYNDSVVKSGYFKGVESVNFVTEILDRYAHYKNIVPADSITN